jgi:hypothetical protein
LVAVAPLPIPHSAPQGERRRDGGDGDGRELDATREVPPQYGRLWFVDESYIVLLKRD